jgi:hypothetical protein
MTEFLPANRVNFIVLSSIIVDLGTDLLRTLFQFRWVKCHNADWVEDVPSVHLTMARQTKLRLLDVQWPLVLDGRLLQWDISILAGLLRYGNVKVDRNKRSLDAITALLNVRNECYAHMAELSTSMEEFNYSYENIKEWFISIGMEIENWRQRLPLSSAANNLSSWTRTDIERRMGEMLDMGDTIDKVAKFEARLRVMTTEWNRINTRGTRLSQQLFEKFSILDDDTDTDTNTTHGETSGESSGMDTGKYVPGFELNFSPEKAGTVPFSHVTKITIGDKIKIDKALYGDRPSIYETSAVKYIGIERIHKDQVLQLAHLVLTFDHVMATCTAFAPKLNEADTKCMGKYYAHGVGGASKSVEIFPGDEPFLMNNRSEFFFWRNVPSGDQQKFKIKFHFPRDQNNEIVSPPYV